jgi:hypothetical protein
MMDTYVERKARVQAKFDDFKISVFNATGDLGFWTTTILDAIAPLSQLAPLIDLIGGSAGDFGKTTSKAFGDFGAMLPKMFTDVGNLASTVLNSVGSLVSNVLNSVGNAVSNVLNSAGNAVSSVLNSAGNAASKLLSSVGNAMSRVFNTVANFAANVMNSVRTVMTNVFNAIGQVVLNSVNAVGNFASGAFTTVGNFASKVFTGFGSVLSKAFVGFRTIIASACRAISVAIGSIPIVGWIAIAITAIIALGVYFWKTSAEFRATLKGIGAVFSVTFYGIRDLAKTVFGGIGELIKAVFRLDADGIRAALDKMKGGFTDIGAEIGNAYKNAYEGEMERSRIEREAKERENNTDENPLGNLGTTDFTAGVGNAFGATTGPGVTATNQAVPRTYDSEMVGRSAGAGVYSGRAGYGNALPVFSPNAAANRAANGAANAAMNNVPNVTAYGPGAGVLTGGLNNGAMGGGAIAGGLTATGGMPVQPGRAAGMNVTIERLVEKFEINTTNLHEDLSRVKDMVVRTLVEAVNDVTYAI